MPTGSASGAARIAALIRRQSEAASGRRRHRCGHRCDTGASRRAVTRVRASPARRAGGCARRARYSRVVVDDAHQHQIAGRVGEPAAELGVIRGSSNDSETDGDSSIARVVIRDYRHNPSVVLTRNRVRSISSERRRTEIRFSRFKVRITGMSRVRSRSSVPLEIGMVSRVPPPSLRPSPNIKTPCCRSNGNDWRSDPIEANPGDRPALPRFSRLLIEPFDIAAREDWERFI